MPGPLVVPIASALIGAAGNIIGGKRDDDSRTSADQTSQQELISRLLESITKNTKKGTAQTNTALADLVTNLPGIIGRYNKDTAIADSKESVTAAINEALNTGLPDVRSANSSAGAYNSTATQLLRDNVLNQAAQSGAKVRQDTIAQYAGIQESGVNALLNALGLQQEGNVESEDLASSEGKETSLGTTKQTQVTDVGVDY